MSHSANALEGNEEQVVYASESDVEDLYEDDCPTLVARFDVEAYAKASATWEDDVEAQNDMASGVRRSFPTLTREIGQLPNEPEEDAILRSIGGPARVLEMKVTGTGGYHLEREHDEVLPLIDGARSLAALLDACALSRIQTLRAIEELLLLELVG